MSRRAPLLMNPGPVTLSPRVRAALDAVDLCHREPEFVELQTQLRDALVRVHPADSTALTAVLLTGSGTAAVEAMTGSLIPPGARPLVVSNGIYGERMARMFELAGRDFVLQRSEWTRPVDLAEVERTLDRDPKLRWLVTVHHETTTGRLNDLHALGALCRERGVGLLLDAVSSFGAEEIDWEGWNLQACAATANKCLHGVPGLSFVVARASAFEAERSGSTSLYLDLFGHRAAQEAGAPAFTPAVHVAFALREALAEFEEAGGWQARRSRYRERSARLREGLGRLGVEALLPESDCASSLTAFRLPPKLGFEPLHAELKRAGYVIYAGQQHLGSEIFRLAVMGALELEDIESFLRVMSPLCREALAQPTA